MSELTNKQLKLQIRQQYRKSLENTEGWWSYLETARSKNNPVVFNILVKEVINEREAAKKRLGEYLRSDYYRLKIRKYCNYHGYSDIDPYEVISVISPRKIVVREMDAVLVQAPTTFHGGGFLGHTENSEQVWECKSNETNRTIVLTLTKKGWGQGQYKMSDEPRKFYDYNY